MKKPKQAFATGKDSWASTLKKSRQNIDQVGRSSQNKMPQRKNNRFMNGEELLKKALTKKAHGKTNL